MAYCGDQRKRKKKKECAGITAEAQKGCGGPGSIFGW